MVKLPSLIALPFGYVVTVSRITDAEMRIEDDEGGLPDGIWDVEHRTIYVRNKISGARKVEALGHELDHAVNDWRHWMRDEGVTAT